MRGRRGGNVPVRRGPGEEAEAAAVRPARGARPLVARGAARRWWRRRGRVLPRLRAAPTAQGLHKNGKLLRM